jgi:integrase
MPKLLNRPPRLCHEKASNQGVVRSDGKKVYLGRWGDPQTKANYDRVVAEWLAHGRRLPTGRPMLVVNEMLEKYWDFAEGYYVKNGSPTKELSCMWEAMGPLRDVYGSLPVEEFGPVALKTVRQRMIEKEWCRTHVNHHVNRIRRIFKWAVESELVSSSVLHALQAVAPLRKGRSEARESDPVKPVPEAFVRAVLPHVSDQVSTMIQLQSLTGMRSGEVVIMRGCDLKTTGKVWTYTPSSHKTEHHGHERIVYLGPKAQRILKPWLKTHLTAFLFSPAEAEASRHAERRQVRQSPMTPSQAKRKPKRQPKKPKRDHYSVDTYRQAIDYGIAKRNEDVKDDAKKIPHWHPHQLRHNIATRLRRDYGIDAARVILGHKTAAVTEIYAEADQVKAAAIMSKVG